MTRLAIGLEAELAIGYLMGSHERPYVQPLLEVVQSLGVDLAPYAPRLRTDRTVPQSEEVVWFTCHVDDSAVEEAVGRLLEVRGVVAAYVDAPAERLPRDA